MRRIVALLLCLTLAGCAAPPTAQTPRDTAVVVATTYPVYALASAVLGEGGAVELHLLISQQTGCLHDYTLTTEDMRLLETADLLLLSGAGLEDFLPDVGAETADCSAGVELLVGGHDDDGHDHSHDDGHDHDADPHYWLDPRRAAVMMGNIAAALTALDPAGAEVYAANAAAAQEELALLCGDGVTALNGGLSAPQYGDALACRKLIVFHDGFSYLADALGLTVLRAMEIEDGAVPSARELAEVVELVRRYDLPAVFTELYGDHAAAQTVARETGAEVYALTTMLSPPDSGAVGLAAYRELFFYNVYTLKEALS